MFNKLVSLIRLLGCPDLTDGVFSYRGPVSEDVVFLIDSLGSTPGLENSITIHGGVSKEFIDIDVTLPFNDSGYFYLSIGDMARRCISLSRGVLPENYYIANINYASFDDYLHQDVVSLKKYAEFVRALSALSVESDGDVGLISSKAITFVVYVSEKDPPKTIRLITKPDPAVFKLNINKISLIKSLMSDAFENKIYIEEKRMIMRMAIAEFLAQQHDFDRTILNVLKNWDLIVASYRHNLQAFISRFSFEKVRKEIAGAVVEHTTKLSSALGDIAGKLLGLPVSFAGIILLVNAKNTIEFLVYFVSLIIVTIIFGGVLLNQYMQIARLRDAFDIIFSQYDKSLNSYPLSLRRPIQQAKDKAEIQWYILIFTLLILAVISLIPAGAAFYFLSERFS